MLPVDDVGAGGSGGDEHDDQADRERRMPEDSAGGPPTLPVWRRSEAAAGRAPARSLARAARAGPAPAPGRSPGPAVGRDGLRLRNRHRLRLGRAFLALRRSDPARASRCSIRARSSCAEASGASSVQSRPLRLARASVLASPS